MMKDPICYCFAYTAKDLEGDVRSNGLATILDKSGAALARVVGVLVEVPVMFSLCGICNRSRHWFAR